MSDVSYLEVSENPHLFDLKTCMEALLDGFKPDHIKSSTLKHCLESLKPSRPLSDQQAVDYIIDSAENDGVINDRFDSETSKIYLEWAIQSLENGDYRTHLDNY